jgi:hypothetical protein
VVDVRGLELYRPEGLYETARKTRTVYGKVLQGTAGLCAEERVARNLHLPHRVALYAVGRLLLGHTRGLLLSKRVRSRHIIPSTREDYTRGDLLDTLQHALKEWTVAVKALERGETALVVRKGGIREKAFAVPKTRFLFFKSYEHQKEAQLKPLYHDLLRSIPERQDDGPVVLTSFAEVHKAYEVSELYELEALDPYHIWTPEYAESRLKWRPKKPLTVLVLRTYLLPKPIELPYRAEYGGCKSWIELEKSVPLRGSRPALGDGRFMELAAPALEALEGLRPAPVSS